MGSPRRTIDTEHMHHDDPSNEPIPLPDTDPTPDDDLGFDPAAADSTVADDALEADPTDDSVDSVDSEPIASEPVVDELAIDEPAADDQVGGDDSAQQAGATHDKGGTWQGQCPGVAHARLSW